MIKMGEDLIMEAPDMANDIDLVKYGVLWQKVQDMDKKMDKLETQIDQLLELANRSKGGMWFGMTMVSSVSGFVGFIASQWRGH